MEVAGLVCPKPLLLRMHVLVMGFIGQTGWSAPHRQLVSRTRSAEAGAFVRACVRAQAGSAPQGREPVGQPRCSVLPAVCAHDARHVSRARFHYRVSQRCTERAMPPPLTSPRSCRYQKCRLVHADLSEYNILYFQKQLYFIDVSQAVEHEHPRALDFLRKDCSNINAFFHTHVRSDHGETHARGQR
jgi:hypothetical protein